MKKLLCPLFCVMLLFLGVQNVGAYVVDLTAGKGDVDTWNDAIFQEFTDEMQTTVSAGTGVIDPFLTIQANGNEAAFNSDYFAVMDATRPSWNHSIQISDLSTYMPGYYEFLLDINQNSGGDGSLLTQHELEIYLVSGNGSIEKYNDDPGNDLVSLGTLIWDLDGPEDSTIEFDYDIWSGSGQNIDMGVYIPQRYFAGYDPETFVYLYAQFGELDDIGGNPSNDGFEEYVMRTTQSTVPEPSILLLLGTCLAGLFVIRRKKNS